MVQVVRFCFRSNLGKTWITDILSGSEQNSGGLKCLDAIGGDAGQRSGQVA